MRCNEFIDAWTAQIVQKLRSGAIPMCVGARTMMDHDSRAVTSQSIADDFVNRKRVGEAWFYGNPRVNAKVPRHRMVRAAYTCTTGSGVVAGSGARPAGSRLAVRQSRPPISPE